MKAQIKERKLDFQPVEITFTVETEEEALVLYQMSGLDCSIPRVAERELSEIKISFPKENIYKVTQNFLGLLRGSMRDTVIKINKRYE